MLPFVFGGVCEDEVEVELEVELLDEGGELDELEEEEDEDEDGDEEEEAADEEVVVVLGAVVVVVDVDGVHDSDSFAITPVTGSWIEDSGVPGGTSTLNVSV